MLEAESRPRWFGMPWSHTPSRSPVSVAACATDGTSLDLCGGGSDIRVLHRRRTRPLSDRVGSPSLGGSDPKRGGPNPPHSGRGPGCLWLGPYGGWSPQLCGRSPAAAELSGAVLTSRAPSTRFARKCSTDGRQGPRVPGAPRPPHSSFSTAAPTVIADPDVAEALRSHAVFPLGCTGRTNRVSDRFPRGSAGRPLLSRFQTIVQPTALEGGFVWLRRPTYGKMAGADIPEVGGGGPKALLGRVGRGRGGPSIYPPGRGGCAINPLPWKSPGGCPLAARSESVTGPGSSNSVPMRTQYLPHGGPCRTSADPSGAGGAARAGGRPARAYEYSRVGQAAMRRTTVVWDCRHCPRSPIRGPE